MFREQAHAELDDDDEDEDDEVALDGDDGVVVVVVDDCKGAVGIGELAAFVGTGVPVGGVVAVVVVVVVVGEVLERVSVDGGCCCGGSGVGVVPDPEAATIENGGLALPESPITFCFLKV
jgi:hypothetical protein